MLTPQKAIAQVQELREIHERERMDLNTIRRYWKGHQALPEIIPTTAPREVKTMARIARVNICPIVVDSLAQSTFVDGFRIPRSDQNSDVWRAWQANKMDAHQTAIHRAAYAYGTAYAIVMPGDPVPVIRPVSPREFLAVYGEDPDWPMWGLQRLGNGLWKLFDEDAFYYVSERQVVGADQRVTTEWEFVSYEIHGIGVVPVIRYVDEDDLDADDEPQPEDGNQHSFISRGQIAPLMTIQDQIDITTFLLLVAQWYGGFRQRYILGWVAENEAEKMKASAAQIWMLEGGDDGNGDAGEIKVGEFSQTDPSGYIENRKELLKYAATLSQTPVHELVGELVNLSAEALAAAEAGHERRVGERKTNLGESHEQMLGLVGQLMSIDVAEDCEVVWRDTSARTFAATVDALGKLATMLDVPKQELWERIPGVTQQDVERWQAAAQNSDSFDRLAAILDRQAKP